MQLFACQNCGQLVYFENSFCVKCGFRLGYLPDRSSLSAVQPDGANWVAMIDPQSRYRFCRNWELSACNWLVGSDEDAPYCRACRHNRMVPDLSSTQNQDNWRRIEEAKRRLFYSIIKMRLPAPTAASGDPEPLIFDFLSDPPQGPRVMTGHDNGVITIALSEADDATRESARQSMGEQYRTLLGHFRHESGHYYWDKLVRDGSRTEDFRRYFGDERLDYSEALQRHYRDGAPPGWQDEFVSPYATMHPWEDWAECWAHYLHIVDTLEMAAAYGLRIDPTASDDQQLSLNDVPDLYDVNDFAPIMNAWLPLTYAVNSLNRCMGQQDAYPFVIAPGVVTKLAFIHGLVMQQ